MGKGAGIWRAAAMALALVAAGCTIDDSGPIRSVWRQTPPHTAWVDVFFLTDRAPDASRPGGFGTAWADAPSCGSVTAIVPPAGLPGDPPQYAYIEKTSAIACAAGAAPYGGLIAAVAATARAQKCDSVLLYIHGFNTGFDGAVLRGGQLAHDLQFDCPVLSFAWTSDARVDRYIEDIEHSGYAEPMLAGLLRALSASGLRVAVVAHSMGNRLVLTTLAALAASPHPPRPGFIAELVLAAADIGIAPHGDDFRLLLARAAPMTRHITVYASHNDVILLASQALHGGIARAGSRPRAIAPDAQATGRADVIDASRAPADNLGHMYYAMSYETVADMSLALAGVPAAERLHPANGERPTLACAPALPCDGFYALALLPGHRRGFKARLLRALAPLIPYVE